MIRPNAVRTRLAEGRPAVGCWNAIANPMIAEMLGHCGFDAIMLDHEHGAGDVSTAVASIIAIQSTPAAAMMRVPDDDPATIKRVLDIGIEGVMIPSIETPEQAERAVAACKYPPRGNRGAALTGIRASRYGMAADDYHHWTETELMVILQIESVKAVDAIPEIASVQGVDMLFVGPQDLSGSAGLLRGYDEPAFLAAMERAETAIRDSDVWFGSVPSLGRSDAEMVASGIQFLCKTSDTRLLVGGGLEAAAAFREMQ
ncbi:MAG: aldolase/citrate lyase family protein [Pseudomonadota bacterium]